jgi:hypothetical protein
MTAARCCGIAIAIAVCLAPQVGWSAPPVQDPNWPCVQRQVPLLSAATLWRGTGLDVNADWRAEPQVAVLVGQVAPRTTSAEDGVAAIAAFVKELSDADRARLAPLAFLGLVTETNRQRSEVISRLKDFGERQRNLSELVARLTAEYDAIPATASGDDAKRRDELADRLAFTTRAFEGMQRTIRYACEVPGKLEARLGAYARALEGH